MKRRYSYAQLVRVHYRDVRDRSDDAWGEMETALDAATTTCLQALADGSVVDDLPIVMVDTRITPLYEENALVGFLVQVVGEGQDVP